MTTHRAFMLAVALAVSLTLLCGPEAWRQKISNLRYRSRVWLRLIGLIGVLWVGLLVTAVEGQRLFGISFNVANAIRYSAGWVGGILIGLIVAQLTLRHELGDQFRPEQERPQN